MNLDELSPTTGTYVCVKYHQYTQQIIQKLCTALNIPNPVPGPDLHTTIAFSTKTFDYNPVDNIVGVNVNTDPCWLEQWNDRSGGKCLVLRFNSKILQARFDYAMSQGATYDKGDYRPHITLTHELPEGHHFYKTTLGTIDLIVRSEDVEELKI